MNAVASSSSSTVAAEQRAHEPSMEEILASIRKIIADDQMLPLARRDKAAPEATGQASPLAAALAITASSPAPAGTVDAGAPQDSAPELETVTEADAPAAEAAIDWREPLAAPPPPLEINPPIAAAVDAMARRRDELLLSPTTGASVTSAFEALTATMFMQNAGLVEEAVRNMLRPMLRQWLDNNLPVMVERLVRAEIERVARGGRA